VLYGGVADEILRRVPVPVLLVSAVCTGTWAEDLPLLPVIVPVDGSERAERALRPARDLAVSLGSELLLLSVVEPIAVYPYRHLEAIEAGGKLQEAQAAHYLAQVATSCEVRVEWQSRRASLMVTRRPKSAPWLAKWAPARLP
jgi:nucleotide-binding universal stress UspA family protein